MEGPDGVRLGDAIGVTDRGSLWRASRQHEDDRIVRIVEPQFCDGKFKQALARLREQPPARMMQITEYGWSGANFFVEYAVDPSWQTLEERFARLDHWRDRILVLRQVCEAIPLWHNSPVRPLGINLRNVVLTRNAGRWFAWLLPCPAIAAASPCDLFGLDSPVIAALAPELIRGVPAFDQRAPDSYALGTLLAQAIGCPDSRWTSTDESRIEAQARGALLHPSAPRSQIPAFLRETQQIKQLFETIRHYRHATPAGRPRDAELLRSAAAAATDPITLAETLRAGNPAGAIEVLSWVGDADVAQLIRALQLAADINMVSGNVREALRSLDRAVPLAPDQLDLREQRCDVRWQVFQELPPGSPADLQGDLLLKDIAMVKHLDPARGTEPYLRAAEIYHRRGDPTSAANELYEAIQVDPSDLRALLRYARCWVDLEDATRAAAVANRARRRITAMVEAGVLTRREGQQWHHEFNGFPG